MAKGSKVLLASVAFNLNNAMAAAGSLDSVCGSRTVGDKKTEALERAEAGRILEEHIVAIGTGMTVTGIGPIDLVPTA